MKTLITPRILLSLTTLTLLPLTGIHTLKAQTPPATSSSSDVAKSDTGGKKKKKGSAEDLSALTDAERAQFTADMAKIKDDPKLVTAQQAVDSSTEKKAKKEAKADYNKVRHDLLVAVDPSIEPVLAKIQPQKKKNKKGEDAGAGGQ